MDGLNVVDIFMGGVSGAAHEADDLAGLDLISLLEAGGEGGVLLQMGVVIVAPAVQRADANPPAAVLVPAHGFHRAGFDSHNGGAQGAHKVVAQVLSGKAVAPPYPKVVAVAVAVPGGNGREGLEAVGGLPDLVPGLVFHQNGIVPHQAAQSRVIGVMVIGVVFKELSQKLLGALAGLQVLICLLHGLCCDLPSGPAGCQGQQVDPAHGHILLLGADVQGEGLVHGFVGDVEIHPFDVILCPMDRDYQKRQYQDPSQKPPFHTKPPPWYCVKRRKLYARKFLQAKKRCRPEHIGACFHAPPLHIWKSVGNLCFEIDLFIPCVVMASHGRTDISVYDRRYEFAKDEQEIWDVSAGRTHRSAPTMSINTVHRQILRCYSSDLPSIAGKSL